MKKVLCITITVCLLAGLFAVPASAESVDRQPAALQPGESLAQNPVYYMDFSPDADGKFYDSPAGAEGRKEVARQENPDGIVFLPGSESNADNQIIKTVANGNTSRIYAKQAANDLYVAFSKGETAGDMNCGASGAAEDYCLKSVDTSNTNSYTAVTGINFPETYGGEEDSRSKKYRFEMDWKWQAYSNLTTQTSSGSPTGATIIAFIIGGKLVHLNCAASNDTDVRGGGAFRFYEADKSANTAFGFTGSSQRTTDESLLNSVTKTAAALPSTESGQWQHITIDFDFSAGTIDAVIQGAAEKREISTKISKGADIFAQGISGIEVRGSTKTECRINYADNIKITPIMTESPTLQADDTKLKWQAIDGATGYKVYSGASEAEALASTTPVEGLTLDTTSEDGYVIAALDNLDAAAPTYYTVTAISANKGESIKSNAVKSPVKNFISDITYEITGSGSSQATVKATAEIDAVAGFDSAVSLIAAAYDGDTLIGVNLSEPVSLGKGETQTIEVSLGGLPAASTQDMEMKFFLWDANLKPIKMRSVTAWDASVVE